MTFAATKRAAALAGLLAGLALTPAAARGQATCVGEPSGVKLKVVIEGVRSDAGIMTATLYGDDPKKFLKRDGELKVWRVPARSPVTDICVWLPGPGTYAMAVYHDAKLAHRFTQGPFGMPTQDYGFSRNPRLFLGPPSLNAAKVVAGEGETTTQIRLKYP